MQNTVSPDLIETFSVFVAPDIEDEKIDLIRAALVIARTQYPDLEIEMYATRVEQLARRVAALVPQPEPRIARAALNHVLFDGMNLRGNREDYYDPRNSFLNDVLDRGLGIPITLSIVYMEVARRVGFSLSGVGMPGHFLLKYYDDGREKLIDCFNRGDLLSRQDCQTRLNEIKQRALLRYSMNLHSLAAEDLDEYLRISPKASDADEIRQMALSIRRMLVLMN